MNAPEPHTATAPTNGVLVAEAPLVQFAPSLTNPKGRHTREHLEQLAASIKPPGRVLQPVTARPWPATRGTAPKGVLYEIIIGEGRHVASDLAGRETIPYFWVDVGDEEALLMQLTENLQRQDLTALQEAEGFQRLIADHGYNADRVGEKFKISRSQVYARLKLLDLCPGALKYLEEGKLDASTALLVARIPDAKLQEKAAKEIAEASRYYDAEPMSYRQAVEHVQSNFMLKLAEAPFSRTDETLVPTAGRCQECPKRTGNQKDIFSDVKSADVCTDPTCYEAKRGAHVLRQQALAKAENRKVIKGDKAKKLKPNSYGDIGGGYVSLDKTVYTADGKHKTVRQLLGKDAPAADLLMNPHKKDEIIEVVAVASIKDQLEAKGVLSSVAPRLKSDDERAKQKAAKLREKIDTAFSQRLFDQVRSRVIQDMDDESAAAPYLEIEEERMVGRQLFELTSYGFQGRVARTWLNPKDEKTNDFELVGELKERIGQMDRKDIAKLMLDLTLISEAGDQATPQRMLEIAKHLAIDADALKAGIRKELTPKDKPAVKAQPVTAKPGDEKLPAEAALPADSPFAAGDRVRVNATVTAPRGSVNIGKIGKVTGQLGDRAFMVAFPTNAVAVSYDRSELDKLPPTDSAPTPAQAAQASGKGMKPGAPAKVKIAAKKKSETKAKTKTSPAPASPANEPAAPVKTAAEALAAASAAWPFPKASS